MQRPRSAASVSAAWSAIPWKPGEIPHLAQTAQPRPDRLAGAAGFEPAHGGTKSRCLTTWLRPNRGRTLVPARSTGKSPGRQRARANWCAKRAGPRQITLAEEPARRYTPRRWFRSVAQLGRALSSGGRGREFESRHSDQRDCRRAPVSGLHGSGESVISAATQGCGRSSGVEHYLAKVRVVSSNLIARSNFSTG